MFLIFVLYFLFAVTFILAKGVISYIQPIFFVGMRMTIAGIILLAYQYYKDRSRCIIRLPNIFDFIQVAIFHIFIAYVGEFWALKFVTAAKASLIFNLTPFITAIFSYLLLKEQLTKRQWIGLMIGFVGLIPILVSQTSLELLTRHIGFVSMPEIALLVAVSSGAYSWLVVKRLITQEGYAAICVNGYAMLGGGLLSLGTSALMEGGPIVIPVTCGSWNITPIHYSMIMVLAYTGTLILIANIFSYNAYAHLLTRYSATFLSFCGLTTPLFTAFLDWLVFGEIIGLGFVLSMIGVILGLILFYKDELHIKID